MPPRPFGTYGTREAAQRFIDVEVQHGESRAKFGIVPVYVGRSIDPAYSDENGYAYHVTLDCNHSGARRDPCPNCLRDECLFGTSKPGADEYERRKNGVI